MSGGRRFRGGRLFRSAPQAEVGEELAFHIEEPIRANIAAGMEPEAARAAALARFGDVASVQRDCAVLLAAEQREERRRDWFGDLAQDLRFGARGALRAPLFTLLAVTTLALGIGANAAVFGVVKSVLLDALPYADADRLVRIYTRWDNSAGENQSVSAGAAADFAERLNSLERVGSFNFSTFDAVYVADSGTRLLPAALVDGDFFATLGAPAALGRAFDASDFATPVVVIGHGAWQREFGGDPDAIGSTMRIGPTAREIIGVLPAGFTGPMGDADVWLPLNLAGVLADPAAARGQHWLGVVARLAGGATPASAQSELDALAAELSRAHPATDRGRGFALIPLRDAMVGDTRTPLLLLMASAALVLLITCANLAGALLSRTVARRKEFAVRVAPGAGRGRLVRQLLTESLLIALAGAAAGLLLASLGLTALRGVATGALPSCAVLALDTASGS